MAYADSFVYENLPPAELMPDIWDNHPDFQWTEYLNCADRFLKHHIDQGHGNRICVRDIYRSYSYQEIENWSNQIAHTLIEDYQLKSGNRVLIRGFNNAYYVALWFAIVKVGGIVVATMPLLRAKELQTMCDMVEISHLFCDDRLMDEVELVNAESLQYVIPFSCDNVADFEMIASSKSNNFNSYPSKAKDVVLLGFTSGTTGKPKVTSHYHLDVLRMCQAFPEFALSPTLDDVFTGSPPIGFTFGLGGLVLFPLFYGASTYLIEKASPDAIKDAIENKDVSVLFTAPMAYRALSTMEFAHFGRLRKCVSAGETLPEKVWKDWFEISNIKIIDGIGATEMLHIFISSTENQLKAGATGIPVKGYEAKIIDENGEELGIDQAGKLAVRGITGCKYLIDQYKQKEYVQNGWNITGDIYKKDEDGFYWFVARGDDMIISMGYNISAIEVENVLIEHPDITECAVTATSCPDRGMIVCAHIVLVENVLANEDKILEIQEWFKTKAAPYKCPRLVKFIAALPKTETGKIQRFRLKESL